MFGSEVLDVLIGLAFIYLLLSLVASAVREGLESILKARAVHLETAIREMLDDAKRVDAKRDDANQDDAKRENGLTSEFYDHPLISSLFPDPYKFVDDRKMGRKLPTFIPPTVFATALLDLVTRGPVGTVPRVYDAAASDLTVAGVRRAIPTVASPRLARILTLLTDGAADMKDVIANAEQWFNDCMDRASARYRRRTQWGLLIIGTIIVGTLNVDTVAIANHLIRSKGAREALVARADAYVKTHNDAGRTDSAARAARGTSAQTGAAPKTPGIPLDSTAADIQRQVADIQSLDLPIGWNYVFHPPGNAPPSDSSFWGWITRLFGLAITIFAISLGAPFWFDAIKRMVSIRSAASKSEDEKQDAGKTNERTGGVATAAAVGGVARPAPAAAAPPDPPVGEFVAHAWATGPANGGIL